MSSVSEKILDEITGHSVDLVRVEAGLQKVALRQLKKLERSLVSELEKAKLGEVKRTQFKIKRMEKLLAEIRPMVSGVYNRLSDRHTTQMKALARSSEKQAVSAINNSIKAEVLSVGMSKEMIEEVAKNSLIQGAPSREWWMRQSGTVMFNFKNEVRQGILRGSNNQDIIREVRKLMGVSRRSAESLVRTSVQTVANNARVKTYENNNDVVKGVEFVSTLDNRTTQKCMALDGLKWDLDGKPIGNHNKKQQLPPVHWNCRSTTVPILKTWEELGAKSKFKEVPESTRASMGGQVSASKNYESWLESKPEDFQKEVLGKGKWKLWQSGKIGFTDLIDQKGNELTLTSLEAKLGLDSVPDDSPDPLWAVGDNLSKARGYSKALQRRDDIEITWLDPDVVIKNTAEHQKIDSMSSPLLIGERLEVAKERLETGEPMNPPEIGVSIGGKVFFSDGRHRTLASKLLKFKKIPFVVPKDELDELKKLLNKQ